MICVCMFCFCESDCIGVNSVQPASVHICWKPTWNHRLPFVSLLCILFVAYWLGAHSQQQLLNSLVTKLLRGEHHHHHSHGGDFSKPASTKSTVSTQSNSNLPSAAAEDGNNNNNANNDSNCEFVTPCNCCADDPNKDLENLQHMAEVVQHNHPHDDDPQQQQEEQEHESHGHGGHEHFNDDNEGEREEEKDSQAGDDDDDADDGGGDGDDNNNDEGDDQQQEQQHDEAKLMRMSVNTALAIGLHNFPEGLATFVATLNDPKVGGVLATAIAIHNIPEGLCVAMPIYYATGKRWKAFAWACLSGASEPVAALLGWAVLANWFSDTLFGVLFGLVAGMMVIISARELIPTAHRYDPEDTVVTYSFICGMMIMAFSLVLFVQTA